MIGKVFSGQAVRDLSGPAGNGELEAPRPARPQGSDPPSKLDMPGSDGYRFRHMLIRDVAYQRIAKQARAELHERFADWIERARASRARSTPTSPGTTWSRRS